MTRISGTTPPTQWNASRAQQRTVRSPGLTPSVSQTDASGETGEAAPQLPHSSNTPPDSKLWTQLCCAWTWLVQTCRRASWYFSNYHERTVAMRAWFEKLPPEQQNETGLLAAGMTRALPFLDDGHAFYLPAHVHFWNANHHLITHAFADDLRPYYDALLKRDLPESV